MRKLIGAIVATGVVVTTVAFVRQRETVSRCPERKAVVQKGKPLPTTKRLPCAAPVPKATCESKRG
jgi:hypothetical protein